MKKAWQKFEEEAATYLNNNFHHVNFNSLGQSNSNVPDINVVLNDQYLFSIETKLSIAQSGQFVIFLNNNKFHLSEKDKGNNPYNKDIIDHLNDNITHYTPNKQEAIEVCLDKTTLANWVREHFRSSNSKFIITSTELNGFKAIIPTIEIEHYFNVSAVVRRKKSGTRSLPKKNFTLAKKELGKHLKKINITGYDFLEKDSDLLVRIGDPDPLDNKEQRYFSEGYYLSPIGDSTFKIKKTSTTNNINVVFSLEYIGPKENYGLEELKNYIHSNHIEEG